MWNVIPQLNITRTLSKVFMSLMLFFFFCAFTTLHYLLDYYQETLLLVNTESNVSIMCLWSFSKLVNVNATSLNLLQVYFFPFIYVFLFVTILSIVFCLSYNTDELASFMFYCSVILIAGYTLFFTDSLILFFFCIWNAISTVFFYSI